MSETKEVEIEIEIRGSTDEAYRVYDGKTEVWIPKSQITDRCEDNNGVITSIFIPEWLADEKGLT